MIRENARVFSDYKCKGVLIKDAHAFRVPSEFYFLFHHNLMSFIDLRECIILSVLQ
jgi:hypothetical protein